MEFYKRDEYKKECGIYGIVNHLTGDTYIGQTKQTFLKRFLHHQWKLKNGTHDNKHLQNAYNLYGDIYFTFFPLKLVNKDSPSDYIDELEIKYINIMRKTNHCYNIIEGGNTSRRGVSLSDEHKKAIGAKNKNNMLGKKHSEETKRKMSESRKGKIRNRKDYRITIEQVIKAKELLIQGLKPSLVAKQLNVPYSSINALISNNCWYMIEVDGWDDFLKKRKTYKRLTKQDHEVIYKQYINGESVEQLAEQYGKTKDAIKYIIKKFSK